MTHIPPHLSEENFRTYEGLIYRAVHAWPAETSFVVPGHIAPTTFLARFRDAILSVKMYSWEPTNPETPIDVDKLRTLGASHAYVLNRESDRVVWFRSRGKSGRPNMLTAEARSHAAPNDPRLGAVPVRDMTDAELDCLCLLLGREVLTGTYATKQRIPDARILSLTEDFNVGIVFHDDLQLTIIN